jgi:hypothetical protein
MKYLMGVFPFEDFILEFPISAALNFMEVKPVFGKLCSDISREFK